MNAKSRVKSLIENGREKKKTENDIKAAAKGAPLNLSKISYGSVRENGLSFQAQGNPTRLNRIKEKAENKNASDRLYEKSKKEAASAKKKKASDAVTREANAKLATARLYAKKKNMEK